MRNKAFLGVVAALLLPLFAAGQNVSITGTTNRPDELVRLLSYDEMFTCHQTLLADTRSDKDGKFHLEASINEITPAQIALGLERVDVILSPDGSYDFEITVPEKQPGASFFEKEQPTLVINSINDGGVYLQYIDAELFINDYIYQNFNTIYRGRKLSLLDSLDAKLAENVGEIKSDYVLDMIKYKKAAVVTAVSSKKAMADYFDGQAVLYSHTAYMDAFFELFKSDVSDNDFLSRNPQLAELIAMNEQQKKCKANPAEKQNVINYLENIIKTTKYAGNKLVATNLITSIEDLSYDSKAPDFALKDKNGNIIQLSDYKNDMVLLQFVDGYSPLLEHEFATLNELRKQWNDTIQVVTIATEDSFDEVLQLFEKQGFEWQLLNLYNNMLLLEKYHVVTFPSYIILKKKGRVGMAPAPSPEHQLEKHVRRISKYL